MIKGVLIVLLLSGESLSFESEIKFPDIAACRNKAVESILTFKDDPNIAGMGFTCKPIGELG